MNLDETSVTAKLTDENNINVGFLLLFKNYGQGIAQNIKLQIYTTFVEQPGQLVNVVNNTIANEIYPGVIFNRNLNFIVPSENVNLESKISIKEENIPPIALVIKLDYEDKIEGEQSQTFWMGYQMGRATPYHLSIEEKINILKLNKDFR